MRFIRKGKEPKELQDYRRKPGASYNGLNQAQKQAIRDGLAQEQGYLCCYCMRRIDLNSKEMQIEHWVPQSGPDGEKKQLEWGNLLGVCNGNKGNGTNELHCDAKKGDSQLQFNPTEERCERSLKYLSSGKIESNDSKINRELNEVLGLNVFVLINNRKSVLNALLFEYEKQKPGEWTESFVRKKIEGDFFAR